MYRKCFLLFLLCLNISMSFILLPDVPRRIVKVLKVSNGGSWGRWGVTQFCAEGTYAVGYQLKIEQYLLYGDDTSLNAIALVCKDPDGVRYGGKVTSNQGIWGTWYNNASCHNIDGTPAFLTAFQLQVQRSVGDADDTAANYVKFKCRDFGSVYKPFELASPPGRGDFGQMGGWSDSCPPMSAICGIKTRVEHPLTDGDDTALNDVEFYCCVDNPDVGK